MSLRGVEDGERPAADRPGRARRWSAGPAWPTPPDLAPRSSQRELVAHPGCPPPGRRGRGCPRRRRGAAAAGRGAATPRRARGHGVARQLERAPGRTAGPCSVPSPPERMCRGAANAASTPRVMQEGGRPPSQRPHVDRVPSRARTAHADVQEMPAVRKEGRQAVADPPPVGSDRRDRHGRRRRCAATRWRAGPRGRREEDDVPSRFQAPASESSPRRTTACGGSARRPRSVRSLPPAKNAEMPAVGRPEEARGVLGARQRLRGQAVAGAAPRARRPAAGRADEGEAPARRGRRASEPAPNVEVVPRGAARSAVTRGTFGFAAGPGAPGIRARRPPPPRRRSPRAPRASAASRTRRASPARTWRPPCAIHLSWRRQVAGPLCQRSSGSLARHLRDDALEHRRRQGLDGGDRRRLRVQDRRDHARLALRRRTRAAPSAIS